MKVSLLYPLVRFIDRILYSQSPNDIAMMQDMSPTNGSQPVAATSMGGAGGGGGDKESGRKLSLGSSSVPLGSNNIASLSFSSIFSCKD